MERLRYAVIPTHDRPTEFAQVVTAVAPQVDHVITVAHDCTYPEPYAGPGLSVLPYRADIPNISTMWNLGLDYAADLASDLNRPYDVAVLNDDVGVPPNWFTTIAEAMRASHAVMGSTVRPGRPGMAAGFAFILDGEAGLRADEQFQWWAGDDDLQRQAAMLGPIALVPDMKVEHHHPNSTTVGELAKIAGDDLSRFAAKWGH